MRLAEERNFVVIEDCAAGAWRVLQGPAGRPVGTHRGLLVLPGQDHHDGGEGGLLALDDDALWGKAWSLKDHGKVHERLSHQGSWPRLSLGGRQLRIELSHDRDRGGARLAGSLQRLPSWRSRPANRQCTVLMETFRKLPGLRDAGTAGHDYARLVSRLYVRSPRASEAGWDRDGSSHPSMRPASRASPGAVSEIYREKAFVDAGFVPPQRLPKRVHAWRYQPRLPRRSLPDRRRQWPRPREVVAEVMPRRRSTTPMQARGGSNPRPRWLRRCSRDVRTRTMHATVLFSSAGRRVALIECFRRSASGRRHRTRSARVRRRAGTLVRPAPWRTAFKVPRATAISSSIG